MTEAEVARLMKEYYEAKRLADETPEGQAVYRARVRYDEAIQELRKEQSSAANARLLASVENLKRMKPKGSR